MTVCLALISTFNGLIALSSVAIAFGLYLFFRGLRLLARRRRRNVPTCKIRDASLGRIEVTGSATGPHTISAPIAGKPCFLYRTTAWQQRNSSHHEWEIVASETRHVPFFLDDSTGQLLIEPLGADLDLQDGFCEEYTESLFFDQNTVPPPVSLFLARHGVTPARRIRVEECCIEPQSVLFIVGTLTENPGVEVRPLFPKTDFPETNDTRRSAPTNGRLECCPAPPPEIIQLSTQADPDHVGAMTMTQQSKIAAALTKAGLQNHHAWAGAGVPDPAASSARFPEIATPSNEKRQTQAKTPPVYSPFGLTPSTVLMKGAEDATFLISRRSQQELVRSLARKSTLLLSAATALTLFGLFVLLLQLQLL